MPISYKDSWDEIQEALILSGNAVSQDRTRAEDAVKIKLAVESIEHQKLLLKTTRHLTWATIGLAIFTAALVLATVFPRCS
jgi:hypothetical protein